MYVRGSSAICRITTSLVRVFALGDKGWGGVFILASRVVSQIVCHIWCHTDHESFRVARRSSCVGKQFIFHVFICYLKLPEFRKLF